jgi:hypothetical protein
MLQNEVISYNSAFLHSRQITHKNTKVKKKYSHFALLALLAAQKNAQNIFTPGERNVLE